jgi:hypothetical protein
LTKPFRRDDVMAALARRLASLSPSLSVH